MEKKFTVIDSWYRGKKPLIITTNLKREEIKNLPDCAWARIYGWILGRCAPNHFDGKNFQEENARATRETGEGIVSQK